VVAESKKFSESWMVDSEVICVSRVVESHLEGNSNTVVVVELSAEQNHPFLPMPRSFGVTAKGPEKETPQAANASIPAIKDKETTSKRNKRDSSGGSKVKAKDRKHHEDAAEDKQEIVASQPEYYWQPRYASGQLFVGSVVTSLAVNSFYNPTLCKLVSTMSSSDISCIEVKLNWVGKSYFEFFDHLLWAEQLLAVGIFRTSTSVQAGGQSVRRAAYVYTAPPGKETTMLQSDRVLCFQVCKAVSEKKPAQRKNRTRPDA
jgi:hypothetical protein